MVRFRLQVDITVALQHATGMHPSPEEVLISTLYWLALSYRACLKMQRTPLSGWSPFGFPSKPTKRRFPKKDTHLLHNTRHRQPQRGRAPSFPADVFLELRRIVLAKNVGPAGHIWWASLQHGVNVNWGTP